jgi:hypothetical protein
VRPEQQIHRAVIAHLRQRAAPGVVFIHVPNGGFRRPSEAAIFSGLGVRAGVCDLLLWHRGRSYGLELKSPTGRTSAAQKQFLHELKNAGAHVEVAMGLDDALAILERWQLLRGKVQ